MRYKPRPGVALVSICKTPVLIPNREAFAACNRIQKLPTMWAILWETISMGKPLENLVRANMILTKKSESEVRENIESICEKLCEMGFLIKTSEESE